MTGLKVKEEKTSDNHKAQIDLIEQYKKCERVAQARNVQTKDGVTTWEYY